MKIIILMTKTINIENKIRNDDGIELLGWYHEKDLKNKTICFFMVTQDL